MTVATLISVAGFLVGSPEVEATSSETSADTALVRVAVTWGVGGVAEPVYAALVAEDAAWRQPAAEFVGNADGQDVVLAAPAGRYRLLAGAPGRALHVGDVMRLGRGDDRRVSIALTSLSTIAGTVVDRQGKKIEGAVVAHLRALSDSMPNSLSPLARDLLSVNMQTRTTADGSFLLPARPNRRHFVWIEASGFAPVTLRDVLVAPEGLHVPPVELPRGSRLRVVWQPTTGTEGIRLEVRPERTAWFDDRGLKRGWILWDREVRGREQLWPSLVADTYEIWAKGPADSDQDLVPLRLATGIELRAGTTTEVEVAVPTLEGLARSSGPSALVQVVSGGDGRPVAGVELIAVAEADVDELMKALERGGARPKTDTRVTDEHGWARFAPLSAGTWHFVVMVNQQPWPHLSQAFEMVDGHEMLVEIELPLNGSIVVEPAAARCPSAAVAEVAGMVAEEAAMTAARSE